LEFITEVDEQSQVDEELEELLNNVKAYHTRQITHYKRLLEQSQSSSSLQLHALQAEVKLLRTQLDNEKDNARKLKLAQASMGTHRSGGNLSSLNENWSLSDLFTVEFDQGRVKKAIKALKRKERLRL
jgi:pyrimidine and pyridine-specific 5'-nucleotidase